MQSLITSIAAFAITVASLAAHLSGDPKAEELLAQARAALGGEKVRTVQGLSASGTYRREVGDRQFSGELTLDLQLPDKMLRTETMNPMGDATITMEQGLNGDRVLRHSSTIGGGPNMIIRMQPPTGAEAEAQALRNARAELARLTIALLLTSPSSMPVEFAYGGEAEAEDGKAQVIDAKGPGNFAVRLFLDKSTHRPLMTSYKGVAPRVVMQTQQGPPDPERLKKAEQAAAANQPPPGQLVDISMFFDEYRQVDGIWLPHHISRSIDGKPSEEWTFKTFRINPTFKADTFAVK
jgi:hypothetical protein